MGAESLLLGRADGDNAAKRCAGALVCASAGTRRRKALLRGRRGDRQNDATGENWLRGHPLRDLVIERYLKHQRVLQQETLSRLVVEEEAEVKVVCG